MALVIEGVAAEDPIRAVVDRRLNAIVGRARAHPTSAQVTFTDLNGPKGGLDMRCAVTVTVPRRPTVHASAVAADARSALDGALEAFERELLRARGRRLDLARRPKKYFVAHEGLRVDGEAALPPPRRRRRRA